VFFRFLPLYSPLLFPLLDSQFTFKKEMKRSCVLSLLKKELHSFISRSFFIYPTPLTRPLLQCNNLLLMSATKRNSNVSLLLFFLYRLTNVRMTPPSPRAVLISTPPSPTGLQRLFRRVGGGKHSR
jgi:hypothetical protein